MIFSTSHYLTNARVMRIVNCFIGSCFFAAFFCIINGLYYFVMGNSSYLFYHDLGSFLNFHAVYFSVYVSFCIYVLIDNLSSNWKSWLLPKKIWCALLILFFFIFLIL